MTRIVSRSSPSWRLVGPLIGFSMLFSWPTWAQENPTVNEPIRKKLIHFGWGMPDTAELRREIRDMETFPFDGMTFRIKGRRPDGTTVAGYYPVTRERWDESWFAQAFEDLRHIRFEKFTDNFIDLGMSPAEVDWFSDDDWAAVCHNVEMMVKAAVLAKCKGTVFDPELYGKNTALWRVPELGDAATFNRYARQVRARGKQYIEAIGRQMPDAVILCLILASYIDHQLDFDSPDLMSKLARHHYALLPAFQNGMLDGIKPGMKLIDGFEASYHYHTPLEFYRGYHAIKHKTLRLIAPENRRTYRVQVEAGFGIYVLGSFNGKYDYDHEVTTWENSVHYALRTTDEYVWCYNNAWLWWPKSQRRIARGAVEGILNAKDRIAGVEPSSLRDLSQAPVPARTLVLPTLSVPSLGNGAKAPVVDGDLSDPAWRTAAHIKQFIRVLDLVKPSVGTEAWVTWDENNLYVAMDCSEPLMDKVKIVGRRHDDDVHNGDSVDVFVSAGPEPVPFHHFIVNPDNVQADFLSNIQWDKMAADRAAYNAQWHSAVTKHADRWTVEIALPWKRMDMKTPVDGTRIRANLARTRRAQFERSSWSPTLSGFNASGGSEPYNFGYWTFSLARP